MLSALLEHSTAFVATFSRPLKPCRWQRVVVRGLQEPNGWRLRVEAFTERQSFTEPAYEGVQDLDASLDHILSEPFRQVLVQTPEADHHILRSFKQDGVRTSVRHAQPTRSSWTNLVGDVQKRHLLTPEHDGAFLHLLDLANADGSIRAPMADKFRQVNHLLSRVASSEQRAASSEQRAASSEQRAASSEQRAASSEFVVVDAGCGKAYLSLSLVYVLERMGQAVHLIGIDSNPHVIEHCQRVASQAGFANAEFVVGNIDAMSDKLSVASCDMLITLHACDTATDAAIALGLSLKASRMLVAPCCHHEVQKNLKKDRVPEWARPLLEDGITKERLGDLLTDTMRRDILRWQGYDAHLEEFIALEHTQKNILINAQRTTKKASDGLRASIETMITTWGVHPKLWDLLQR